MPGREAGTECGREGSRELASSWARAGQGAAREQRQGARTRLPPCCAAQRRERALLCPGSSHLVTPPHPTPPHPTPPHTAPPLSCIHAHRCPPLPFLLLCTYSLKVPCAPCRPPPPAPPPRPPPRPQEGHCKPGEVLFGTDSHTCNAGAFGQFATGVGNTDAGFILGTGKLLIKVGGGGGLGGGVLIHVLVQLIVLYFIYFVLLVYLFVGALDGWVLCVGVAG